MALMSQDPGSGLPGAHVEFFCCESSQRRGRPVFTAGSNKIEFLCALKTRFPSLPSADLEFLAL